MSAPAPAGVPTRRRHHPMSPSAALVLRLQSATASPCVTVALRTEPGAPMATTDVARLDALVQRALARLEAEPTPAPPALADDLRALAEDAAGATTDRALLLFAGGGVTALVRLPVDVRERVAVDASFATRDLIRALHRTPRHTVLLLTSEQAVIHDSGSGSSIPAPLEPRTATRAGAAVRPRRERNEQRYLSVVDARLGAYRRLHPSPLVVVGPRALTGPFLATSRHAHRLAGVLDLDPAQVPAADLEARIREAVTGYLASRHAEAVDLLRVRSRQHRVAAGMPAAWLAARTEPVEMLAVEETLVYPARLLGNGDLLVPARDVEAPDVLDDAVDELIALALDRGGWVAFAEDGELADYGGVAVTVGR